MSKHGVWCSDIHHHISYLKGRYFHRFEPLSYIFSLSDSASEKFQYRNKSFTTAIVFYTCLCEASRTFNSLPFNGNTPYLSRPTTLRPAIAKALAESPSVTISVQSLEFFVPALFASSSFGIPFKRLCLLEAVFLFNCASLLNFTQFSIFSRTPQSCT